MEIEAKFRIDDDQTFPTLLALSEIGPFTLSAGSTPEDQRNVYFDTADRRLRAAQYGLRVRTIDNRRVATLKGAAQVHDGMYERDEWEVEVGPSDDPATWPNGEVRERTLALVGNETLAPILSMRTLRQHIYAMREHSRIAEMSLDEGDISAGGLTQHFRELEIELLADGSRTDLDTLVQLLRARFALQPEDRSKLARGLALLDAAEHAQATDSESDLQAGMPTLMNTALMLFGRIAEAERLPGKARKLLHLAVASYEIAAQSGAERGDRAGRDMVLASPIPRLNAEQQSMIASVVALQREKIRPNRESSFVWLGEREQHTTLVLAAVLRLARAIGTTPAALLPANDSAPATLLLGSEPVAAVEDSAALWREVLGELVVRAASTDENALLTTTPTNDEQLAALLAHIQPLGSDLGSEPIAELARRTLRRFFDKLLAREEAVLRDEDSEDVHQMRVATRRLRAALQTLEGVFEPALIRRYRKGLRKIAQSLGTVRDGDVVLEHLHAHRDTLPKDERAALQPLIDAVTAERTTARAALLHDLQSKRYRTFKRKFGAFLSTPGSGTLPSPEPGITQRVRDFAGAALWRRYELWRSHESALPTGGDETLHQARIAGKRLRYTLEFFAEALGNRVDMVLDPLIDLQECLGNLQDGVTAHAHVAALGLADDPGAQAYLAVRTAERAPLLADLPRLWNKVDSGTYRRRLFELIVKL